MLLLISLFILLPILLIIVNSDSQAEEENVNDAFKQIGDKYMAKDLPIDVPTLPEYDKKIKIPTTEYAIYDIINDRIIIQVYTKGSINPVYVTQTLVRSTTDSYYYGLTNIAEEIFEDADIYDNTKYEFLGEV